MPIHWYTSQTGSEGSENSTTIILNYDGPDKVSRESWLSIVHKWKALVCGLMTFAYICTNLTITQERVDF